ncbi:hypothetical protein EDD11_003982 [Mortierella claussenii]|nr:hypothetical protein EDD11_003982 [Mortierella claussenii]
MYALSLPPKGYITVGESNSALVHVSGPEDPKLKSIVKKHGELKAALTMPSRNTHIPQHHKVNAAVEELLDTTRASGLIPQPILDRIEELSKQWDLDAMADAAGTIWKKAWDVYNSLAGSYDTIVRHDKLAKLLIRKVAWHPHQPLLAIALWNDSVWVYDLSVESWYSCGLSHPAQSKITSLHWKPMSGVVLAIGCEEGVAMWHVFRDHSPSGIDAAWAEPANPLKDRPSELLSETFRAPSRGTNHGRDTAWIGLNLFKDLGGVDQMAWDPRGELLAVGSSHSPTVYIRDGATKKLTELRLSIRPTPPRFVRSVESFMETVSNVKKALGSISAPEVKGRVGPTHEQGYFGPTVCSMTWSPCGKYLLVAYSSEVARIYETATWEYVEMKDLKGAIQSACWTPDGYNLIYSLQGDDLLRAIHFERRAGDLTWIPLNYVKMSLRHSDIELYKSGVRNDDNDGGHLGMREHFRKKLGGRSLEELTEFGAIEELALDPNGERLIVRFEKIDLLGVVIVRPTGTMLSDLDIFMPTGFIEGLGWSGQETDDGETSKREPYALTMAFTRHFHGGSMLSVAWESGRINFMPFYYLTQQEVNAL